MFSDHESFVGWQCFVLPCFSQAWHSHKLPSLICRLSQTFWDPVQSGALSLFESLFTFLPCLYKSRLCVQNETKSLFSLLLWHIWVYLIHTRENKPDIGNTYKLVHQEWPHAGFTLNSHTIWIHSTLPRYVSFAFFGTSFLFCFHSETTKPTYNLTCGSKITACILQEWQSFT